MFSYLIDTDYPYDQNPYFNNRRRRYYNPHQSYAYSYPCYTHPLQFSNFHTPQNRHFRESYYDPENIVNLVSGLNQNHEEKNHHDKEQKRNGYRKIKILAAKQQAAKKIYNFLKHQPSTHRTRKILVRLLHLRNLQNLLNSLSSQNQNFGPLTFTNKDAGKQILPISKNNKMLLIQEDSILKILDQLDKVQSEGNEIVRDRRKEIVKIAQKMLEELDAEKDRQWKLFCDELENNESVVNENSESIENENNESIENENSE
ncbi:28427_t:CDS:2, partial [Racocetra persica]